MRIKMFAPLRIRCGISDYSRLLMAALSNVPDVIVDGTVAPPDVAVTGRGAVDLPRYAVDEHRFRSLGQQLNVGVNDSPIDIAHIQHQYFFFGGVAPHKSHIRALLNAIRVPLVMTVHEVVAPVSPLSILSAAAIRLANRRNYVHPAIGAIFVHTSQDLRSLLAVGVPKSKLHVVTHGVPQPDALPNANAARRDLGLEGRRVVTLFGFLSTKKGHHVALDAIRRLPSDVLLLFAGDQHPDDHTEYVSSLRAEIEGSDLSNRVRITGYLAADQIPVIMAATDIAIAPFIQSSGSGSLANLIAYERPIVASDIPPHREIAAEEPACLALFEAGSGDALAGQILRLLGDSDARIAFQSAARTYAARHSYAQMARETVEIYAAVRAM